MNEIYRITRSNAPRGHGYYNRNGQAIMNRFRLKQVIAAIKRENAYSRLWNAQRPASRPRVIETFKVERAPVGEFEDVTGEFL